MSQEQVTVTPSMADLMALIAGLSAKVEQAVSKPVQPEETIVVKSGKKGPPRTNGKQASASPVAQEKLPTDYTWQDLAGGLDAFQSGLVLDIVQSTTGKPMVVILAPDEPLSDYMRSLSREEQVSKLAQARANQQSKKVAGLVNGVRVNAGFHLVPTLAR